MHIRAITMLVVVLIFAFTAAAADAPRPAPSVCTYEMQVWSVSQKGSVMKQKVRHPYNELTPEEIDAATKCTVCSEDQEFVSIPPLQPFPVCYRIAPRVRRALSYLMQKGAPIHTVVGYHVIKSRGSVDRNGNRTGLSNHSFGTAIDINPEQNGLYDNCVKFNRECRLLRGGEWRPGTPGTLEQDGEIVTTLQQEGFRWGGEIAGRQKDFMHFSLTGY